MRVSSKLIPVLILVLFALCLAGSSEARSRCDEMRYRYLQAKKKINTYNFSYKSMHKDYKRHLASQRKRKQTIQKLQRQLVVLKKHYPNEPKMWQGKENHINRLIRGYKQNQKNLNLTRAELNKYKKIVQKNLAIYNKNYRAWQEYGCNRR